MSQRRWLLRLNRFLRVKPVCNLVFKLRFLYHAKLWGNLRCHGDEKAVMGQDYSVKRVVRGRPSDRILRLIQPLAAIDKMTPDSRVLAIGCRFETDMLYLCGYGFDPRNIRGLDMISYSPWIDCGNMHQMPYADGAWDAVTMGWVLSYSDQPELAAREVLRVTRDGGLIAIAVTYYPPDVLKQLAAQGEIIGPPSGRIQTVQGVLDLFQNHVDHIYFHHDAGDLSKQGPCMVIFSVKKSATPQPAA